MIAIMITLWAIVSIAGITAWAHRSVDITYRCNGRGCVDR